MKHKKMIQVSRVFCQCCIWVLMWNFCLHDMAKCLNGFVLNWSIQLCHTWSSLKQIDIAPSIACKWTIQQYLYSRFATQSFFLPYSTADKIQNLKVVAPLSPWEDSQSGEGDLNGGALVGVWGWVGWLGFGLWLAAVASSSKAASKLCWMSRSSSLIQCSFVIHKSILSVIRKQPIDYNCNLDIEATIGLVTSVSTGFYN